MATNYEAMAKAILAQVGPDNVTSLTHCQTRLRFVVKDRSKIDDKAIEKIADVKGVFYGSGQYQVIIGTGVVNKVYDAIDQLHEVNAIYGKDDDDAADTGNNNESGAKESWVKRAMAMLSGIFVPIIPVIAATGLFLGLKSAFTSPKCWSYLAPCHPIFPLAWPKSLPCWPIPSLPFCRLWSSGPPLDTSKARPSSGSSLV